MAKNENQTLKVSFDGIQVDGETYIFIPREQWNQVSDSHGDYSDKKHVILKKKVKKDE